MSTPIPKALVQTIRDSGGASWPAKRWSRLSFTSEPNCPWKSGLYRFGFMSKKAQTLLNGLRVNHIDRSPSGERVDLVEHVGELQVDLLEIDYPK